MIFFIYKVSGHSMIPAFLPAEKIFASNLPYFLSHPKRDDVIVFKKMDKKMIKRIRNVNNDKFYVEGDNKSDSMYNGWINKSDIIAKVIFKF